MYTLHCYIVVDDSVKYVLDSISCPVIIWDLAVRFFREYTYLIYFYYSQTIQSLPIHLSIVFYLFRLVCNVVRVENVDKAIQRATSASLLNFKQDFPSQIRLELRIDTLLEFISIINFADHQFKGLIQNL